MKALENKDRNDEQQDSDDEKIKFATSLTPNRFAKIDIFRALDSFRRQLECPGQNQRHGKSNDEQQHHKTHGPIRNFEEWKNLTRDLHEQPRHDCVRDRNFVNIASLQLAEEILWVHSARLDEALVTAALYLDTRDLKSNATSKTTGEESLGLTRGYRSWPADAGVSSQFSIHFREGNAVFEIAASRGFWNSSPKSAIFSLNSL